MWGCSSLECTGLQPLRAAARLVLLVIRGAPLGEAGGRKAGFGARRVAQRHPVCREAAPTKHHRLATRVTADTAGLGPLLRLLLRLRVGGRQAAFGAALGAALGVMAAATAVAMAVCECVGPG